MISRNIIHSVVIVLTVILCFTYAQKKGFSFYKNFNTPNWDSFPLEKSLPKEKDNFPKLEEKKDHKKEDSIPKNDIKPENKQQPKNEPQEEQKEKLEEKPQEEQIPQNNKPRFFRRGRFVDCGPGNS